jgi:N-acetylneuraminate synthase/N,N'-diacetyllegionaminate synthase
MDLAHQLVDLAAKAGADAFKTQFFDVEMLIAKGASEWRDRLRPRNLTLAQAREIKNRCDQKGLLFMSTAHDETRIPWLIELDVPAVKVGSGERNNPAFLKKLAALNKPMIVSTGMYGEPDVEEAVNACAAGGCRKLALLHCVTSYPTPVDQVNLAAMDRLKAMFPGPVGYSDHTVDGTAALAAVARGAAIIEKHITILRDVPNAHDWKVSAGPETFPQLVSEIRRVFAMIGHGRKESAPCEHEGAKWALKSLVAVKNLPGGHRLTAGDLTAKRPGGGVPPNRVDDVIGRRLTRGVEADEVLSWDTLDFVS